jgi:hypothetical protein
MLKKVAIAAGLAAAPWARSALDQGKATKEAMHYQDQPKDGQQCATCVQFIPGRLVRLCQRPGGARRMSFRRSPLGKNSHTRQLITQ